MISLLIGAARPPEHYEYGYGSHGHSRPMIAALAAALTGRVRWTRAFDGCSRLNRRAS